MSEMTDFISKWYDHMIILNEERENYEACSYFKTSKDAFDNFKEEGTILFRGERYTSEEVIILLKEPKGTLPQ